MAAINGNTAQVRVIIDGSHTGGSTGLVLSASHSIIRGLALGGFGVGIEIPDPTDVGDAIQGNFIGPYLAYPVDQNSGTPLPAPNNVFLAGHGNTQQGILLGSANATVGGFDPAENNVIAANGAQGILLLPGASGNQVLGNQIGVIGPSSNGLYFQRPNGGDGVWIQSSGTASDPASIVYSSSNIIGGAVARVRKCHLGQRRLRRARKRCRCHAESRRGQLTSASLPAAASSSERAIPVTAADGVRLDDAPTIKSAGPAPGDGNVISSNHGAGVYITGADAQGNTIENNIIGLTAAGSDW